MEEEGNQTTWWSSSSGKWGQGGGGAGRASPPPSDPTPRTADLTVWPRPSLSVPGSPRRRRPLGAERWVPSAGVSAGRSRRGEWGPGCGEAAELPCGRPEAGRGRTEWGVRAPPWGVRTFGGAIGGYPGRSARTPGVVVGEGRKIFLGGPRGAGVKLIVGARVWSRCGEHAGWRRRAPEKLFWGESWGFLLSEGGREDSGRRAGWFRS